MLVNRVQAEFIGTNRIDPDYYRPEHLADEKRLRHFGSDELITVGHFFAGPFGSKLPSDLYLSAGVPLFRVSNVGSMEVLPDGMAHLAPEVHKELSDSEVIPGDLLIVKASVGEKICRVPQWMPRANITQHIIGIRPNGNVDMDYVAAFLFCQYGRRQLVRRSLGSIIQYLGITDSKSVLLPRISPIAQKFLGDKLRQSERLRETAAVQLTASRHRVEQHFGDYVPQTIAKTHRVPPNLIAPRIDAWYHNPRFLHAQNAIVKTGARLVPISELASVITNGGTPAGAEFVAGGVPWIRGKDFHDGDIAISEAALIDRGSEESIERSRLQAGDLVLSIKGTVGDVAVVDEEISGANINQDIARIQIGDLNLAHFLALFLESSLGQTLIEQQVYGAINAFFSLENLRVFMVPDLATIDADFVFKTANQRRDAIQMRREAHRFTTAAKFLVEALIDDKVSETDMINAQESLDRGDHSADRALLSRLTRKGLDVPGEPPLFPDLDALYDLLAQTEEAPT